MLNSIKREYFIPLFKTTERYKKLPTIWRMHRTNASKFKTKEIPSGKNISPAGV
jgi:hypothetical protein